MAPEDERPAAEQPAVEAPPPPDEPGGLIIPTWWTLFAGFSFIATVGVLAGILIFRFMNDRPINIEEHSTRLIARVQGAVADTLVPRQNITTETQTLHSPRGDSWRHAAVTVAVPQRLETAGIAALLEKRLEGDGVKLTREHAEGATRIIKAWLGNFEVVTVTLSPAPLEEKAKQDLRRQTAQLVDHALPALRGLGVEERGVFVGPEEAREDGEAHWTRTRIELSGPVLPTVDALAAALQGALKFPEVKLRHGGLSSGGRGVTVSWGDRTALEVELKPARRAARGPMGAMPLNEQPDLGALLDEVLTPDGAVQPPVREANPFAPAEPGWEDWETPSAEPLPQVDAPVPPGPRQKAEPATPRLSIILDDGGFGGEVTERVLNLDPRLTLAILPNTPEGVSTSQRASEMGFEVMLHMPMENSNPTVEDYPGELTVGMERAEMARLTLDAMAQTPGAVGVNNHTGSTFTESADDMAGFLEVVKDRQWYFIDSRTSAKSAALDVAKEMKIPSAKRDVFLDDVDDAAAIRRQWERAVKLAKENGSAIAIGHFRPLTVDLLEEELPRLAEQGITLVHASELVR